MFYTISFTYAQLYTDFNNLNKKIQSSIPQQHQYLYMYYINQSTLSTFLQTKSSKKILISILTIQPQYRNQSDHQYVFQFFYNNKILQDIQRIKSYNAKQQCIANLFIDTKKPNNIIDINIHINGVNLLNTTTNGQKSDDKDIRKSNYQKIKELERIQNGINKQKKQQQIIYRQNQLRNKQEKIQNINDNVNVNNNNTQTKSKNLRKQSSQINTSSQPNNKNMIIIDRLIITQDQQQQRYYVLLQQQKLLQILNKDQKYLRKNIQILKKYTILSQMKYTQLLYLAYYMNIISYKYKQYVYQQGDQTDYLYLVQKGQFHYSKKFVDNTHIHNHNHNVHLHNRYINNQKKNRPKRYDAKLANPNRVKNSISIQHKIGVIQGQSGQSFGQQQILTQTKREYNIMCMSTQNLLIRIPKDKYKKVIYTSFTKIEWLKKENKKKIGFKDQIFNKMIDVKSNYKKYTTLIHQNNLNRTEKVREKGYIDQYTSKQIENIAMSRVGLPKIRSRSIASQDQYSIKKSQKSLSKSQILRQEEQKQNTNVIKRSQKSQETQQNQNRGTFDLTGGDYTRKKKYRSPQKQQFAQRHKDISSVHVSGTNSGKLILPSINTQKQKTVSAHQTLQTNIVKNWSASRPMVELKGLRNKFSGMIDSNSLIKQKQQILNMKLLRNKNQRDDLYPLDLPEKVSQKIQIGGLLSKQETRQMRSAAHSKAFMQKLLVQALKKAGYNSDKGGEQNYTSDTPNSVVDIKNNLRIPKSKPARGEKNNSSHLLEDNAFDQCYFKKM